MGLIKDQQKYKEVKEKIMQQLAENK